MAYIYSNPNPRKKLVGDCVIRGISILTDKSWRRYYYNDDMRYVRDDAMSYRRGRDSMGRYASRDAGHEDKEEMMRELEELKRKIEGM